MTKAQVIILFFAVVSATGPLNSQGAFQNLDFEQAQVVFLPGDSTNIFAANAQPGWTVFQGTTQVSFISYNHAPNPPGAGLLGPGSSSVLDGKYSAFVADDAISQTGLVPADAISLRFVQLPGWITSSLQVSLNGQNLSYISLGGTVWGADISAFAGQTATLTFSGVGLFDDIQFSPELIPEPSFSWPPFLGSGVLLYLYNHKKHSTT